MSRRIVSLLPAATEALFALGLGDQVVAVTYECQYPAQAAQLPKVTDTIVDPLASPAQIDRTISQAVREGRALYTLNRALLRDLKPDLIVTQDLCQVCALPAATIDDALDQLGLQAHVFNYNPMTLSEVITQIQAIGQLTQAPGTEYLHDRLVSRLQQVTANAGQRRPRVLLLEWTDPPYTPGHWIPDMITAAGGEPVLANPGQPSVCTTWQALAESDAQVLIVAPCGFDQPGAAQQLDSVIRRPELAALPAVRNCATYAIDADSYIVRPGPRLIDGVQMMASLIRDAPVA